MAIVFSSDNRSTKKDEYESQIYNPSCGPCAIFMSKSSLLFNPSLHHKPSATSVQPLAVLWCTCASIRTVLPKFSFFAPFIPQYFTISRHCPHCFVLPSLSSAITTTSNTCSSTTPSKQRIQRSLFPCWRPAASLRAPSVCNVLFQIYPSILYIF